MADELRAIRDDEYNACLDLLDRAFPNTPRTYFEKYFTGDPWFENEYTRVFVRDGRLLSAAAICRREVRFGSSLLVMGGIGNVATDPDARGAGLATLVLEDCIRTMEQRGFDFSILYTGINDYYARLRWSTVPVTYLAGTLGMRLPRTRSRYRVRRCRRLDIDHVCRIYDVYNERRVLSQVRTPEYFRGFILPDAPPFYVAEEPSGRICAYVQIGGKPGTVSMSEIGCLPGCEDALEQLVLTAARTAVRRGDGELVAHLPDEPDIAAAFALVCKTVEQRTWTHTMLRVINLRSLIEHILPELSVRSADASGDLALDTDWGKVDLVVRPGSVELASPAVDRETVRLSQEQLFGLLLGCESEPAALDVRASENALSVLRALFPKQAAIYWMLDHF